MDKRSTQHLNFLRLELGRLQQLADDDLQAQRYAALGVAWAVHQTLEGIAWEASDEEAAQLRARAVSQCPALGHMEQLASAGKQFLSGAAEPTPHTVAAWGRDALQWLSQRIGAPEPAPARRNSGEATLRTGFWNPIVESGASPA